MSENKSQARGQSIPANMREKHDAIVALIDNFCREHLNAEYAGMCRRLAAVLARKRPSPLVNGKPQAWASGIVRTIGWVNFLDDPSQKPHMKMTEVDKAFGISSGTGQSRSKAIRDMLRIRNFDTQWTLPSRMAGNPMVWLVQINGMILDIRSLPREVQEEAFQRGMIPYIPADRKDSAEDDDEEDEP